MNKTLNSNARPFEFPTAAQTAGNRYVEIETVLFSDGFVMKRLKLDKIQLYFLSIGKIPSWHKIETPA